MAYANFLEGLRSKNGETIGVSIELEIAFPDWVVGNSFNGGNGIGVEFGILEDEHSFNFFTTTKYTKESSAAFSGDIGLLVATPNNFVTDKVNNNDIGGNGGEVGINIGFFGVSLGGSDTYNNTMPSKYLIIRPSIGVGFEIGMPNWNTNTKVY